MAIKDVLKLHEKWLNMEVDGERADLYGKDLSGLDLSYANLERADLRAANLRGTKLTGANLKGADLSGAVLEGADLSYAGLRYTILGCAKLKNADFTEADLTMADLTMASIEGTNFTRATFRGAKLPPMVYQTSSGGALITYDAVNNRVIMGRWDDEKGNHLDSFKEYVDDCYNSCPPIHDQFEAAVMFFAVVKRIARLSNFGDWSYGDTKVLKDCHNYINHLINNVDI